MGRSIICEIIKKRWIQEPYQLSEIYMHSHRYQKDGIQVEEYERVNQNRNTTCTKITELHGTTVSRKLKQEPWRQQYE